MPDYALGIVFCVRLVNIHILRNEHNMLYTFILKVLFIWLKRELKMNSLCIFAPMMRNHWKTYLRWDVVYHFVFLTIYFKNQSNQCRLTQQWHAYSSQIFNKKETNICNQYYVIIELIYNHVILKVRCEFLYRSFIIIYGHWQFAELVFCVTYSCHVMLTF